jgi:hypothetical protein
MTWCILQKVRPVLKTLGNIFSDGILKLSKIEYQKMSQNVKKKCNKDLVALVYKDIARGSLCVQMDFTRTFEANAKCNNINHV